MTEDNVRDNIILPPVAAARVAQTPAQPLAKGFDPTRSTGFDNPRPTGDGDPTGRYVQATYDPDDPARQPPPEYQAAVKTHVAEEDAASETRAKRKTLPRAAKARP